MNRPAWGLVNIRLVPKEIKYFIFSRLLHKSAGFRTVKNSCGFRREISELIFTNLGRLTCLSCSEARWQSAVRPSSVLRLLCKDFDELVLSQPQILELVGKLGEQCLALTMNALARKGLLIW